MTVIAAQRLAVGDMQLGKGWRRTVGVAPKYCHFFNILQSTSHFQWNMLPSGLRIDRAIWRGLHRAYHLRRCPSVKVIRVHYRKKSREELHGRHQTPGPGRAAGKSCAAGWGGHREPESEGELVSGGKAKIAMWLLDIDYDDRSLFPRQVFFPMAGKDEGWHKLKKDIRAELDEDLLEKFKGTVSLPFEAGENKKVAVKIVDDRGIESVKVIALP